MAEHRTSTVTNSAMTQAQAAIATKIEHLNGVLQNANDIKQALESSWLGQSGSSFGGVLDAWSAEFKACLDDLGNIDEKLGGNQKVYIQSEDERQQQVQALLSQLELH